MEDLAEHVRGALSELSESDIEEIGRAVEEELGRHGVGKEDVEKVKKAMKGMDKEDMKEAFEGLPEEAKEALREGASELKKAKKHWKKRGGDKREGDE